jgi:hypothetical protein
MIPKFGQTKLQRQKGLRLWVFVREFHELYELKAALQLFIGGKAV